MCKHIYNKKWNAKPHSFITRSSLVQPSRTSIQHREHEERPALGSVPSPKPRSALWDPRSLIPDCRLETSFLQPDERDFEVPVLLFLNRATLKSLKTQS